MPFKITVKSSEFHHGILLGNHGWHSNSPDLVMNSLGGKGRELANVDATKQRNLKQSTGIRKRYDNPLTEFGSFLF